MATWQWVVLVAVILIAAYALLTLLGLPLLALLSKLFNREETSTTESQRDYLLGQVTLRIPASGLGEVMVVGNGRARQTYAARSYDAVAIAQGVSVVVIKMQDGVAFVQPVKSR